MSVWDAEVDVLIAGAGAAGLAAAIEAVNAGAQTLVIEKQAKYWECSTALSGGAIAFGNTDFQALKGIRDSDELFFQDLMNVGKGKNNPKLVHCYIQNQLEAYNWLKNLGVKFATLEADPGMSVARVHRTDPLELVRILKSTAESKGVNIVFQTPLVDLVTDKRGGVVGIRARERTAEVRIKARKGVIMACGGFARDSQRLQAIDPRFAKVFIGAGRGNTGDGHKMVERLGGYMVDMECVKPSFNLHATGTSSVESFNGFNHGAIIVNAEGKRFINESRSNKDLAMAALDQTDGTGFQIFDQKIYRQARRIIEESLTPLTHYIDGIDEAKMKLLDEANTIHGLAVKIGISPKALSHTIEAYNEDVENGKDTAFGRETLPGGVRKIVKVDSPPLYAFKTRSLLPSTYAGIAVDEDMRVLTRDGPIAGLYATGEIIGGFHGAGYMGGTSVGKSVIFGRIAGKNAAGNSENI